MAGGSDAGEQRGSERRAVIVGAGGVGRRLISQLAEAWDVSVIDLSEDRLAAVRTRYDIETYVGDGSSAVVLERAQTAGADAFVAATNDDDVNLAAVRIAVDAGVVRVAAAVAEPERLGDYQALGIQYAAGDQLAASRIAQALEPRGIVSQEFANGRAVAIEFHLAGDSPVRGRALQDLHAQRWIAGAVLRNDELIVPHGQTVFEAGDRVTVMGAAGDFSAIVRSFTEGETRFPLEYGTLVAVGVGDGTPSVQFIEAAYMTQATRAEALAAVTSAADAEATGPIFQELIQSAEGAPMDLRLASASDDLAALREIMERESVGVLVLPPIDGGGILKRFRANRAITLAGEFQVAVLFARGSHPYQRVVVPARMTESGRSAARAGVDIARSIGAELTGIAVAEPAYITGGQGSGASATALSWLRDEASVQGVRANAEQYEGNPVRVLLEHVREDDLLVIGQESNRAWLPISTANHLVRRASCSVLVVPALA